MTDKLQTLLEQVRNQLLQDYPRCQRAVITFEAGVFTVNVSQFDYHQITESIKERSEQ